ncbi:MAG: DedA family protein [Nocardioidaceae bacterium]
MADNQARLDQDESGQQARMRLRRTVLLAVLAVVAVVVVSIAVHLWGGEDRFGSIDESVGSWAYLAVFFLVFGDAICALLPAETTLNTASTLAANGVLSLSLVMLVGAAGAIAGDSALYWIARLNRQRLQPRMDAAMRHKNVRTGLRVIGSSAPLLLTFGRYVPGLRLVVNATLGLSAYPYRTFLFWSSVGGSVWAVYTCGLAFIVGEALAGFPLASVVISGTLSTVAIAVVFVVLRRRSRTTSAAPAAEIPSGEA